MANNNQNKPQGFSVVKPKEKKLDKIVFVSIIISILIILGASIYWFFVENKGENNKAVLIEDLKKEENIDRGNVVSVNQDNQNNSLININDVQKSETNFVKIKIPILADPDLFDYKNNIIKNCDSIVFVEKNLIPTPKILNASLKALFEDKTDYGFKPANFVANQESLIFDKVTIENGIAKIYLEGKITLSKTDNQCDKTRIQTQITETALQLSSVKSVEIYLNNTKLN